MKKRISSNLQFLKALDKNKRIYALNALGLEKDVTDFMHNLYYAHDILVWNTYYIYTK